MSSLKAALKAAKTALDGGRYEEAITQAKNALSSDSSNYFARLFLGRALEKQGKLDKAAEAYHEAANQKPDDTQAWLGLCSLYESQDSAKVDDYRKAAVRVAELYAKADDIHRCQTTVDKLTTFTKQNGTSKQMEAVYRLQLPGSSLYDYLEGRVPHPSHTYIRLAEMTEDEESRHIKTEVANRRTRVGARVGQVTTDVKREVFACSELEEIYREIIDWSADDDVRRQYEEKLLQRSYDILTITPAESKEAKLDQLLTLAEGMVIIHHPFELAWNLVLETRDVDRLQDLDVGVLREYIALFPEAGIAKILKVWLDSELSPFPPAPREEEDQNGEISIKKLSAEDKLLMITEGLESAEHSTFAFRLVADYYLHLEEHQTAADTARDGLSCVSVEAKKLGMSLQNTRDALNSVLATALVHHQAPRHHVEARRLFEDILQRKPKFTPALIGLGLILEETEEYQEAIKFLTQALSENPGNLRVGAELAWCKALHGDYGHALLELEELLSRMTSEDPRSKDLRALTLYRTGFCIWHQDSSKAARRARDGAYAHFLSAIKTNVTFAPAYTYLGMYYADYAKDKKRARQCFLKAFELSSAETLAAERLARLYADVGDWETVEIIAQRVVDSGRTRPAPGSKRKGISWPHSALGVAQMNKLEYQQAIVSFLAALRISPDDYQSYVGLGESYHNSGRYNSALRTFHHALDPLNEFHSDKEDVAWFAQYMLSNVHRELGDYNEAIIGLEAVLQQRPSEFGVLLSLLQTFVELAWHCVEHGLFGQASASAKQVFSVATTIANDHPEAFNLWKAVGDACMIFSWVQSGNEAFPLEVVRELLTSTGDHYTHLADIDGLGHDSLFTSDEVLPKSVIAGVLAFKRGVHSAAHETHAQAVAWYNLGWAEQRAFSSTKSNSKLSRAYLRAAVRAFKRAIELEAGNAEFWNALGVVTSTLNPKVAQHSFVRSLHLNELNAKVWTNLGTLYLLQGDYELAHQAFGRSQSTDPDYAHAWVGEGLIALTTGNAAEALNHVTHAFEIASSASLVTKRLYTQSSFDHLLSLPSASNDLTTLIQPLFALQQLQTQSSSDMPHKHLLALLLERVGNHTAAVEALTSLCEAAEADYEASESEAALARFAHAKSDLARNQLAALDFSAAAESAEVALDLSSDADSSGLDTESRRKIRLSAHLTGGLAYFNISKLGDAVNLFKQALQESSQNPDVVCLLVKVLWAQGGEQEKSVAREQLFECVESHPEHVGAVTLLGAIAALDDDTDTSTAVKDDLLSLRTKDTLTSGEQAEIEDLLSALAEVSATGTAGEGAALAEAQGSIIVHPGLAQPWNKFANLTGDHHAAQMGLRMAEQSVPPHGEMEADAIAEAFIGVGTAANTQKAIVLAPWNSNTWTALRDVIA